MLDSWLPVIRGMGRKRFWVFCVLDVTTGPESLYAGNIMQEILLQVIFIGLLLILYCAFLGNLITQVNLSIISAIIFSR